MAVPFCIFKGGCGIKKELADKCLTLFLLVAVMVATGLLVPDGLKQVLLVPLYFALVDFLTDLLQYFLKEPSISGLTKEAQIQTEEAWYASRQDAQKLKQLRPIGQALSGVSIAGGLLNLCGVGPYGFWTGMGILCFLITLILCGVFPAYFSVGQLEGEKGRVYTFPIINLAISFFVPLSMNGLGSFMKPVHFVDWVAVVKAVMWVAAVLGIVTRLVLPEFRRHTGDWVCMIGILLLCGGVLGITLPMNRVLESQSPAIQAAVVTEYHEGSHKVAPSYTLRLEDGTLIQLDARAGFKDRNYRIWATIPVEYHQGALGIDYYCYHD